MVWGDLAAGSSSRSSDPSILTGVVIHRLIGKLLYFSAPHDAGG